MFGLFRKRDAEQRRQAETIKALVRARLGLDETVALSVSEIQCGDDACPGTETVILVMAPGRRTRAYKVTAPMDEVDEAAVAQALAAAED